MNHNFFLIYSEQIDYTFCLAAYDESDRVLGTSVNEARQDTDIAYMMGGEL